MSVLSPNRDKRTLVGQRRYVRRLADQSLLLAPCRRASGCIRSSITEAQAASRPPASDGICPRCWGAILTLEEKLDASSPA